MLHCRPDIMHATRGRKVGRGPAAFHRHPVGSCLRPWKPGHETCVHALQLLAELQQMPLVRHVQKFCCSNPARLPELPYLAERLTMYLLMAFATTPAQVCPLYCV